MTALVIGVGGKLRAGKDEVAMHLERAHGFTRLGMSDALLEHALTVDPYIPVNAQDSPAGTLSGEFIRLSDLVQRVGYVEAKKNPEVRRFLQRSGTEGGRHFHGENVWVDRMARRIDDHLYADQRVVVAGVRFPNELAMIHQFGGLTAWVERPSPGTTPASTHASENGVKAEDFDIQLLNDSTLEHLYSLVDTLLL
ncbi:hypothetical protein [Microbacterium sp. zg-YB36]|uniref:deoxynucleotide monophosphate kinase family protein n=1 Tax=Microbacterium sp. zg-YB36 TaxID=2969407 RepID=UPI00214BC7F2|nr:hypothetical protein [Microbacterium sp. zg-YB36]MDL5351202.1 hypothetical protein [Microbacterium sp. zg-YB36]